MPQRSHSRDGPWHAQREATPRRPSRRRSRTGLPPTRASRCSRSRPRRLSEMRHEARPCRQRLAARFGGAPQRGCPHEVGQGGPRGRLGIGHRPLRQGRIATHKEAKAKTKTETQADTNTDRDRQRRGQRKRRRQRQRGTETDRHRSISRGRDRGRSGEKKKQAEGTVNELRDLITSMNIVDTMANCRSVSRRWRRRRSRPDPIRTKCESRQVPMEGPQHGTSQCRRHRPPALAIRNAPARRARVRAERPMWSCLRSPSRPGGHGGEACRASRTSRAGPRFRTTSGPEPSTSTPVSLWNLPHQIQQTSARSSFGASASAQALQRSQGQGQRHQGHPHSGGLQAWSCSACMAFSSGLCAQGMFCDSTLGTEGHARTISYSVQEAEDIVEPSCTIKWIGDEAVVTVKDVIADSGLSAGRLEELIEQIPKERLPAHEGHPSGVDPLGGSIRQLLRSTLLHPSTSVFGTLHLFSDLPRATRSVWLGTDGRCPTLDDMCPRPTLFFVEARHTTWPNSTPCSRHILLLLWGLSVEGAQLGFCVLMFGGIWRFSSGPCLSGPSWLA